MNPHSVRLLLLFNGIACVSLATLWLGARNEGRHLEQRLNQLRTAQEASTSQQHIINQHLAERRVLIEKRRGELLRTPRSSEMQRRAATLAAIAQLKESRPIHPLPPLPKRPPRTPRVDFTDGSPSGDFFPELLADPEYSSLCVTALQQQSRIQWGRYLRKAGVDQETRAKVIRLYAEAHLMNLDYRAIVGDHAAQKGYAATARQKQITDLENEIRITLGEETYARYSVVLREANTQPETFRFRLENLTNRLSYSQTPLSKEKIDELHALLQQHTGPASVDRAVLSEPFVKDARTLLTPEQHAALVQLQAEHQAKEKRGKLPKSSEIPRL